MRKHIAICTPSAGTWHSEMGRSLAQLCMVSIFQCDLSVLDGRHGSSVSDGRNRLVLGAQAANADGILWIDSDMAFPADALLRLLKHNKEVVGATYPRRHPPYDAMGRFDRNLKRGCIPAEYLPTGMLYTASDVFDKIQPPWFWEEHRWSERSATNIGGLVTEDVVFCQRAAKAGIKIFVDLDLSYETVHISEQYIQIQDPKQEAAA